LVQIVWDSVHSGSGRNVLADNNTDYYPVPLAADTLRPGTVYADPYGHILMIVRRISPNGGRSRHHSAQGLMAAHHRSNFRRSTGRPGSMLARASRPRAIRIMVSSSR
jgi:hypothetical protein